MRKITIEAGQLPELVAQPTYYDRILKAIKESEEDETGGLKKASDPKTSKSNASPKKHEGKKTKKEQIS